MERGSPVAFARFAAEGVPRSGVINDGDVARTTDPVPVTEESCVPLILKTFPTPAVSNVLPVRVCVSVVPTRSPDVGKTCVTPPTVMVPVRAGFEIAGLVIVGDVSVLLVRVWVSVVPTNAPLGTVFPFSVPLIVILLNVGDGAL